MTKQALLRSLKESIYCRIGASKIEGVGVIAIRDIPKGTDPYPGSFQGRWYGFTDTELAGLSQEVKRMIKDFFITVDGKTYVPSCGFNNMDISFFMNHTSNPNIAGDSETGTFYALRDIKAGEELTFNYFDYSGEVLPEEWR